MAHGRGLSGAPWWTLALPLLAWALLGVAVRVETLPGVDHGVDQQVHAVFSTLDFDPEARARAAEIVSDFLVTLPVEPELIH